MHRAQRVDVEPTLDRDDDSRSVGSVRPMDAQSTLRNTVSLQTLRARPFPARASARASSRFDCRQTRAAKKKPSPVAVAVSIIRPLLNLARTTAIDRLRSTTTVFYHCKTHGRIHSAHHCALVSRGRSPFSRCSRRPSALRPQPSHDCRLSQLPSPRPALPIVLDGIGVAVAPHSPLPGMK